MILRTWRLWTVAVSLGVVGLMGCDQNDGALSSDTESVSDRTGWNAEGSYPEGPYGFKPSVKQSDGSYGWSDEGDTIPDMCLLDKDSNEVCLHEYYQKPGVDVLIVDVSALWCSICKRAAMDEASMRELLANRGWNAEWVTILTEAGSLQKPTVETVSSWIGQTGTESTVLFDVDWEWHNQIQSDTWPGESTRSFPTLFFVDPSNMLIWDLMAGWDTGLSSIADTWVDLFEDSAAQY